MKTTKGETWVLRDGSPAVSGLALNHSLPDRPARILWESDYRKLMKLVRDVANNTITPDEDALDHSRRARKLIGRKT